MRAIPWGKKIIRGAIMKKSTLGLAVLLSVVSMQAFAAEQAADKKIYYFDEVVVTASGKPETLFTTKSNTQVITAEQIEKMNYKDVKDAVRQVTGMQFADYPAAGYSASGKFGMNGSNVIKIMVNGMPVAVPGADNMGTPQSYVEQLMSDMDNIERIEVVKGSGSLLYGTDAVGGVINIITKKVDSFKTKVGAEFGSFNHENYKISHQGKFDKTSYRIFAKKYHDGYFKDGNGDEWISRKNGENINIGLAHEFSEGNGITLDYRYGNEDYRYNDYLYGYSPTDNTFSGKTKTTNIQFKWDGKISDKLKNEFFYNYTKYENNSTAADQNYYSYLSNIDSEMHNNVKTNNFKDLFTYGNKDNTLTFGLEYFKSETLRGNTESLNNKAVLLQDNWKFGKGWDLTAGVRFDKPGTSGKADMDSNFAKSVNLGYKFSEKSNMYVGYNDYFVLPSISMLYNETFGNDKLKAEKGKNYEIGFNHKFTQKDVVSVHFFKRNADNKIQADYSGWPITRYYNVDDTSKTHGFDVQYDKTFDANWHAKIGWAFVHSEDSMQYVRYPSNQINLGVDYTVDKWTVATDIRTMIGASGPNYVHGSTPQGNCYMLMDLSVNYKPIKNAKVFLKCNNLFNKYYADQFDTSGYTTGTRTVYARPGRTIYVGAEFTF